MESVKKIARKVLAATGVTHWRYRYDEWRASQTDNDAPLVDDDGVALPSAYLMYLIGQTTNWKFFLKNGEAALRTFAESVDRNGGNFKQTERILDLGCGCGRLTRHLPKLIDGEIFGVDYNARLVKWCKDNLQGNFSQNKLTPPLNFPSEHFDVVYLLSVFTHLKIDTQNEWLAELERVVRPGGFALVTFHDEDHSGLEKVNLDRETLLEKHVHVHNDSSEGSNFLSTFQTRDAVRDQFGKYFDVVEIINSDANPLTQAIAVLRRR